MKLLKIIILSLILVFASTSAKASLIDIYLEQDGVGTSEHLYFNSFLEIMEYLSDGDNLTSLGDKFSGFNIDEAGSININYRGVPIVLELTGTGSSLTGASLTIGGEEIASSNSTDLETIMSDIAGELFGDADFESGNFDFTFITDILKKINEIAVKQTPFDPIAGNPTSFLYRNLDYSYNSIMYDYVFRPSYTRHSLTDIYGKKKIVQGITLPLGFALRFTDRTRLAFNTMISATDYSGAISGDIGFGTTFVLGTYKNDFLDISLAGGLRAGLAGSLDFATIAPMWNAHGGILTKYQTPIKELELVMLNNIGYYSIPQLDLASVLPEGMNLSIPYELTAIGAKNGITANYYFTPNLYATFSVIDTRFFKYEQYISFYEEFRLGVEFDREERYFIDNLAFFFAYKIGEKDYSALELGFGLSF